MPPFLPVILAGAALYGAYKWAQRQMAVQVMRADEARRQKCQQSAGVPRDLGTLEFDPEAKVYRPRNGRAG